MVDLSLRNPDGNCWNCYLADECQGWTDNASDPNFCLGVAGVTVDKEEEE